MNEDPLSKLTGGVNKLLAVLVANARSRSILSFTKAGPVINGPIKEWYGTAISVNGVFTLDISSANFSQILHVSPEAIYNSSDFNKQAHVSLNLVSLTSITGRVVTGAADVFKTDAMMAAANTTIMVKVTGF